MNARRWAGLGTLSFNKASLTGFAVRTTGAEDGDGGGCVVAIVVDCV